MFEKEKNFYFLAIAFGFLISVLLILFFVFLPQFFEKPGRVKGNIKKTPLLSFNKFSPEILTLEQIFSENHNWTATLSARRVRTLIATGDVIPTRSVNFKAIQYNNFKWSFEKTASVLRTADLTLINLESPLIKNCPLTNTGMKFCGDPRHIEGLTFAGVDVVNLANNHIENYGTEGVNDTINILEEAEILYAGIAKPVFQNLRGLKLAFLGYNDVPDSGQTIAQAEEEKVVQEVKEAQNQADLVIVSFHWGEEYVEQPTKRQKELAHLVIDSGADLIIGHHPHRLQPVEIYKGKLIMYSHGNFIFDQMWSEETKKGVVGRYAFYDKKLIDVEFLPIYIADFGQPYFQEGREKEKILEDLESASIKLKNYNSSSGGEF